MKLVTYDIGTPFGLERRLGVVEGDRVIDLIAAYADYLGTVMGEGRPKVVAEAQITRDMTSLLQSGEPALAAARAACAHVADRVAKGFDIHQLTTARDSVWIRTPVSRPISLRDTLTSEIHDRRPAAAANAGPRQRRDVV